LNKLSEMHSFVTVADTGSISEAARRLGTAKSMVCQRIQQLEKRLGSILLERGRQTRLTESGEVFIVIASVSLLMLKMPKTRS
jgi:DNA-binding transcriptional LysR family regulator